MSEPQPPPSPAVGATPSRSSAATPSAILGRYRVTARIAAGSAGSVFSALDERTGAEVAVKCFDAGRDRYARWLDETRLIMRLTHPNVVEVLDAGHDDAWNLDVLVFARALGGSLRRAIVAGAVFTRAAITRLLRDVAAGLTHAHELGVVHRDVKPENILALGRQGGAPWAITDFGVGRHVAPGDGVVGTFAGSPGYHAPEVLDGHVQPALDQFSLGVVGVELLTRARPDHAARLAFVRAYRGAASLEGVLARMLDVDPTCRFPSMAAVIDALELDPPAPGDVTRDAAGVGYTLQRHVLRAYGAGATQPTQRARVPRALRFCSLRGQPLVVCGERRIVSLRDRPHTRYVSDQAFQVLAASLPRDLAWIRRGDRLCLIRMAGGREFCVSLPQGPRELLDGGARPLGVVIDDHRAVVGFVGHSRVLWCSRGREALLVRAIDLRLPLYDASVCAHGVVMLFGGPDDALLLAPTPDGLSELDRCKRDVAGTLIDASASTARLLPDAISRLQPTTPSSASARDGRAR